MKPILQLREDLAWMSKVGTSRERQTIIEQESPVRDIQRRYGNR
jgi:hypothetical protein